MYGAEEARACTEGARAMGMTYGRGEGMYGRGLETGQIPVSWRGGTVSGASWSVGRGGGGIPVSRRGWCVTWK